MTETDTKGYLATVNGESKASISGTIVEDETEKASFTNTKPGDPGPGGPGGTPNPAKVTLTAQKTLDGKTPEGSSFTFVLTDAAGNVIQTTQNNGGAIAFDTLTFDRVGTFIYTISEQAGAGDGVVYDSTVYTVTVNVTKNGDYQAAVSLAKDGQPYTGEPLFANTTESPDEPETPLTPEEPGTPDEPGTPSQPETPAQQDSPQAPALPKTGQLWWPVLLLFAAGIFTVTFGLLRRRRGAWQS